MSTFLTAAVQSWWSFFVRLVERLFITRADVRTMRTRVTVNQRCRHMLGLMGDMDV